MSKYKRVCVCLYAFRDRPSVNAILKKPLLQAKIRKFLTDLVLHCILVDLLL